ncbi:hypothetical protein VS883_27655, partial [Escherichia coli]
NRPGVQLGWRNWVVFGVWPDEQATDSVQQLPGTAHYTMAVSNDQNCETRIKGLFAVGESFLSLVCHGANRPGVQLGWRNWVVFGVWPDEQATDSVQQLPG